MKKILVLLIAVLPVTVNAQDIGLPPRPYTKAEMARWEQICLMVSKAFPKTYKDYTVRQFNCSNFEWTEKDNKGNSLTVINKKNQPIGNHPYYNIWFDKSEDSAQAEYNQIVLGIQAATKPDGSIDAEKLKAVGVKETKMNQCKTLSIEIMTNQEVDISKQYHGSTKPVKLNLPIKTFAYLYLFPWGKTMLDDEGNEMGGTDAQTYYRDKALIVISSKPPKTVTQPFGIKSTFREDKIYPQDMAPDVVTAPLKNIFISISGEEKDVRAMVEMIDWKWLVGLIGK